jgi:hypothetical protein
MPTTHKSLLQADPLNKAQRKRYSFLYQYHLRMYDYCEKNEVSSEQLFRHALVCVYPLYRAANSADHQKHSEFQHKVSMLESLKDLEGPQKELMEQCLAIINQEIGHNLSLVEEYKSLIQFKEWHKFKVDELWQFVMTGGVG